jgi:undecaprenyl-diphosphatase
VAVPVMFVATAYEMSVIGIRYSGDELAVFLVGFAVAFVVALVSVKMFLRILNRCTLQPFAWYRIIAAPIFFYLTSKLGSQV